MNPIGQRLRAAMRDTADEITPDRIPPLRLPPGPPRRRLNVVHVGGPPRWRWLAPLAAEREKQKRIEPEVIAELGELGVFGATTPAAWDGS